MDLDTGLLQRDKEKEQASEQRSGNLREVRRQAEDGSPEQALSLRQATIAAKKEKLKEEAKSEQQRELTGPNFAKKPTSRMLRQAWLHTIDSFGFTSFIWANIHVALRSVFGDKFFCKLGHEWSDLAPAFLRSGPGSEEGKERISMTEKMGLGLLDFIMILFFLGIAFVFYVVIHPYEVGLNILGDVLESWGVPWL